MSAADDNRELEGDDALAAEYVLGALSNAERQDAMRRIESDPAFAALVERWEATLSPMQAGYPEVEPPPTVKAALDRRLFAMSAPTSRSGLWSSLGFWRGLAFAALAVAALLATLPFINAPDEAPQRLVASLSAEGSPVHYLAVYDAATGEMALSHVSGEREPGKDFELWMIAGDQAPVSMGVIPAGASNHMLVPDELRRGLDSGAVLAVSLEPAGGSPTGQPTGAVVAAGDLRLI